MDKCVDNGLFLYLFIYLGDNSYVTPAFMSQIINIL